MYFYITILLLCIPASFSKTNNCFYEDFMDGKNSSLSDSCPEFTENPWKFETYKSAKINRPSFSTADGFIRAGELDKQCVTNNFPLSMKEDSELFIAYRATGDAVLSVELIDFHTSKSVDFIVLDLIYNQWSLDSFTIIHKGDFTFKIIAFTPEESSLIIDSVTYVDNRADLDSCMFDDGSEYDDSGSVEDPPRGLAADNDESEIEIDTKEVVDISKQDNDGDTDIIDDANENVVESEDKANDAIEEELFAQDVANSVGESNGSLQDKTNDTEDENDEVKNVNQEHDNSSEDMVSSKKEEVNKIAPSSEETQEEIGPDNDNDDIDESQQNDDIQEEMHNTEESNNSNEASKVDLASLEDDKNIIREINDDSQSNTQQSTESPFYKEVLKMGEGFLDAKDDNQNILSSPDNANNIFKENNYSSEENKLKNEIKEEESVEFEEISEDINDSNQDNIDTPEDDIVKDADISVDEKVDPSSEDDIDSIKEDLDDLKKIFDDEIKNVEIDTSNSSEEEIKGKVEEKEEIVRNFDEADLLESSQPFSERMPVGDQWVTFLTVVGVILSITCLLVLGAVLFISRQRTKKFSDYPYYHYEIPQATQKSKNYTFPI